MARGVILASADFRAGSYFVCRCLRQLHTIRTQQGFSLSPSCSFFLILFSCERMELSRLRYWLGCFWPGIIVFVGGHTLKLCWKKYYFFSSMSINGLFSWIHEGMLQLLKGLKEDTALPVQSRAGDLLPTFAHFITLRLIRYVCVLLYTNRHGIYQNLQPNCWRRSNWSGSERG